LEKNNNSWHLDKQYGFTLFGSRINIFLDKAMIVKGFGIKMLSFGKIGHRP